MLSEETLKKYFEAIFPYASKYKPNGEQRYWKRFLENKNILEDAFEQEYCRGVNEGLDNYISIVNERYRQNDLKS